MDIKEQDSLSMIEWFRASTSYINAHRGKVFVVLLSGEALSDKNLSNVIYDLTYCTAWASNSSSCTGPDRKSRRL
jgi:hypothetical protein